MMRTLACPLRAYGQEGGALPRREHIEGDKLVGIREDFLESVASS